MGVPATIEQETNGTGSVAIASAESRAAAEVQASMAIAKRFPRDETFALSRIVESCGRHSLAKAAMYAYPKGGTLITGPSIRLAECIAQRWGNIDFGIVELEQRSGESVVMAYAMDLETNTRQVKTFTVRHERKAQGRIKQLDDPRDIYEIVANNGARRLRACILGIIPGDVVEEAVKACERTLAGGDDSPLIDRVRKMVFAFKGNGVSQDMIERRLGHKVDATIEAELVSLGKIFVSIRDGMAKREDFFQHEKTTTLAELTTAEPTREALSTGMEAPQATAMGEAGHANGGADATAPISETLFKDDGSAKEGGVSEIHRELAYEVDSQGMGTQALVSLLNATAKVSRIEDLNDELAGRVLGILRQRKE